MVQEVQDGKEETGEVDGKPPAVSLTGKNDSVAVDQEEEGDSMGLISCGGDTWSQRRGHFTPVTIVGGVRRRYF